MNLDREVPCIYGPVAVALPNEGLEVFAIRQDNYLCHIWTTGPGTWNGKIKNEKGNIHCNKSLHSLISCHSKAEPTYAIR
jgi:hypothetical protein